MNPFTRAISSLLGGGNIEQFAKRWEALETLVNRVYQARAASPADMKEYQKMSNWLRKHYPSYQASLAPHWRRTRIAGEPAVKDPFAQLLAMRNAGEFVANWQAMQCLPAAREALNNFMAER
jgi:hypothetical protein